MKTFSWIATLSGVVLVAALLAACSPDQRGSQTSQGAEQDKPAPAAAESPSQPQAGTNAIAAANPASTNAPGAAAAAATPGGSTNAAVASATAAPGQPGKTNAVAAPPGAPGAPGEDSGVMPAELQVSFKGANIDMVVQWLAKITGKSVVKHPKVQCQLTIVSSKNMGARAAIELVYRALALEGFTTIESSNSILILPEGQDPNLGPALMESSGQDLPEGRQRLVKIFATKFVAPSELRDRLKGVLSEKATIEADDRGNKLIVTDYTQNLRLVGELLTALDIDSPSETTIEIFTLKHLEAVELANLLNLVLNNRPGSPVSPSRPTPRPSSSSSMRPSSSSIVIHSSPPSPSEGGGAPSPSPGGGASAADGAVRLWPDPASNRLIVSAAKSKMAEIKTLIEMLDVQKPADVALRVLPLKHVNAVNLAQDLAPLYQRLAGQSAKDIIEVVANERSNSIIILSSENNFNAIKEVVEGLDTADAEATLLRTFPLANADAEEVAAQLKELNEDRDPMSRFVFYYPPRPSGGTGKSSFVADRRRNTVIVQAPPSSMEGIAQMIKALDEPLGDDSLTPKIIPLKYVSAVDIEDVLNELFLKRQGQRNYFDPYGFYGRPQTGGGQEDRVGKLYGKVRITSEPYSNAIIITSNSSENMAAVEEIIKQLDVPSQASESTVRVTLNFAEAVPMANNLNILFARGGSPPMRPVPQQNQPQDQRNPQQYQAATTAGFQLERERKDETYYPWLGGQPENYRSTDGSPAMRPASELVGRVRVVPDPRSNSLLITANVHFLAQVMKLINELDAPTAQVLIDARIIEVASDFRDRLGVRWSPDGSQVFEGDDFDNSIMPAISADYLRLFTGSKDPGEINSGILSGTVSLDFLIQFMRKNTDASVLAQPQLNVSDNELGKLFVGAQIPFLSSSLNTQEGGRNDSYQYKNVGIILEVTPHINNSDEVALKIHAESSNIRSGETLFGGAIVDTRDFHTDLLVKNGEIVVLGGIIQQDEAMVVRKVPILGDIPLLGWLFKKRDKGTRKVELMVFLSPRITRTPEEARLLLQDIEEKTPNLKRWSEEQEKKKAGKK